MGKADLRRRIASLFIFGVFGVAACAQVPSTENRLHLERLEVPGGAEVDTLVATLPGNAGDFPLVSVLLDTLGDSDPTNDTVRNVWVLSYARPTMGQSIIASLPFVYVRAGSQHRREASVPASMIDMSAGSNTWIKVLHAVTQAEVLDPIDMPVRASTRAYSGNSSDFRSEHVFEAMNVLSAVHEEDLPSGLSQDDLERVEARLYLSTKLFGDLTRESYLTTAFEKARDEQIRYREHNWELLRQKAEQNGLYFQPLKLGLGNDSTVLLWADRKTPATTAFNGQLLGIGNPFEGPWLAKWKGYTETWTFDENGSRVTAATPSTHSLEMVPVALYSLDYPTAPLLLIDFRNPFTPKRHEMIRRAADQVTTGVLGLTTFGNLEYFAAKTTYMFVRQRQGAAMNRSSRLRAYSQFRNSLFLDSSLDPRLRADLLRRINGLGLNPFEDSMQTEAQLARDQYAALRAYAFSPSGLERKLDRDRSREIAKELHSKTELAMYRVATISSFGIYRHTEHFTPELLADIDRRRRFAWNKRLLEQMIDTSPAPEVAFDVDQMQRSLDVVTQIGEEDADLRVSSEELVRRVQSKTSDEEMRRVCADCLQRLATLKMPPQKLAQPTAAASAASEGDK